MATKVVPDALALYWQSNDMALKVHSGISEITSESVTLG